MAQVCDTTPKALYLSWILSFRPRFRYHQQKCASLANYRHAYLFLRETHQVCIAIANISYHHRRHSLATRAVSQGTVVGPLFCTMPVYTLMIIHHVYYVIIPQVTYMISCISKLKTGHLVHNILTSLLFSLSMKTIVDCNFQYDAPPTPSPRFWNSFPVDLRSMDSLDQFKHRLKTHLFFTLMLLDVFFSFCFVFTCKSALSKFYWIMSYVRLTIIISIIIMIIQDSIISVCVRPVHVDRVIVFFFLSLV